MGANRGKKKLINIKRKSYKGQRKSGQRWGHQMK